MTGVSPNLADAGGRMGPDGTEGWTKIVVPPGEARAVRLAEGTHVLVVCPEGKQVADLFAVRLPDTTEYLSVPHTRTATSSLFPDLAVPFVSNRFNPVLRIVSDTSQQHDALLPACNADRYRILGADGHRNCSDNFVEALREIDITVPYIPQPINLFQNTPIRDDRTILMLPSTAVAGDRVELECLVDLALVAAACPQDLTEINDGKPRPIHLYLPPC